MSEPYWEPLAASPAGPPIPTPVQNDKWLKGEGGAVVWADLPATTMPDRLGTVCAYPTGSDWNNALDNGWYMAPNYANAPGGSGNWFYGYVIQHNSSWVTQTLFDFTSGQAEWRRHKVNGNWSAWERVKRIESGYALATYGPGYVDINFARAYPIEPQVTIASRSPDNIGFGVVNKSTTGFRIWHDSGQNRDFDWIAVG